VRNVNPLAPTSPIDPRFLQSHYHLKRQVFKLVGSNFWVHDQGGNVVMFVHQKGFKLKEDLRVYDDEKKTTELLRIHARKIMDFSAAYDVIDARTEQRVGVLRRKGWRSIARDEWQVCDANEIEVATLIEDQLLLALVRRFLTNLIPQNYDLLVGGQRAVDYKQNFNPLTYHLKIDFTPGFVSPVDPRTALAAAFLVAAIEGRQG